MNVDRNLAAITLALTICPLFACDTQEEEPSVESSVIESPTPVAPTPVAPTLVAPSTDYSAAGHIEIASVLATPWVKQAMATHDMELGAELDDCARVFEAAEAVTFGMKDEAFELYISGQLDIDAASACGDKIDGDADEPSAAVVLDADLFVIYRGELEPSRARLNALLTLDPTPNKDQPIWLTGSALSFADKTPVEGVQIWANPAQGLEAHVQVDFQDAQTATELFGQATLGLTALRMSNDVGELASAVDLKSSGQTMTADIHVTQAQIESVLTEIATDTAAAEDSGVHVELHTSN